MKYKVIIKNVETVDEIREYWSNEDYINLLEEFSFPDAQLAKKEELRELLFLAISDFEPNEAAAIILTYKLSEHLTEGQISQMSHEMMNDKIAEEYPDITLHSHLFHINQLLFKAYNGKFPCTKASIIKCSFEPVGNSEAITLTKAMALSILNHGLSDRNIIKRLFKEQLKGEVEFAEAENILWEFTSKGNHEYTIITSDYWLNKEDFLGHEFEGEAVAFEAEED